MDSTVRQEIQALIREAIKLVDEALQDLNEPTNEPSRKQVTANSETEWIAEIKRLIGELDPMGLPKIDERMRVQYVINEASLFSPDDTVRDKMRWCLNMMRKIKNAMTNV